MVIFSLQVMCSFVFHHGIGALCHCAVAVLSSPLIAQLVNVGSCVRAGPLPWDAPTSAEAKLWIIAGIVGGIGALCAVASPVSRVIDCGWLLQARYRRY